jgi:hypothetical protein
MRELLNGVKMPYGELWTEKASAAGSLPGMGGVFNTVNMHLHHYAGNNPVKHTDPDGKFTISIGPTGSLGAGTNGSKTYGIVFGYSKEKSFSWGVYSTTSGGAMQGVSKPGIALSITVDPTAKEVKTGKTKSLDMGVTASGNIKEVPASGGAYVSFNLDTGKASGSINIGLAGGGGTKEETHQNYSETITTSGSDIINSVLGAGHEIYYGIKGLESQILNDIAEKTFGY